MVLSLAAPRSTSVHADRRAAGLAIHLLGRPRLFAGGSPIAIPPRTLPALAYLLLYRGEPLARDQCAESLWPDAETSRGRARLRSALHALLHALPPCTEGWIVADAERVSWNAAAPAWLDFAEFERLLEEPKTTDAAVALYDGDFMPGLDDEWATVARERLRRRCLTALDALVTGHRRARRFDAAIACAERLLEADPWREDIVRRLIATRSESGDRSGALCEYDRFAVRLRAEFGVEPMPETRDLRAAIAAGTHPYAIGTALQPADRGGERTSRARTLPLIGRDDELATLTERWARAAAGSGGTVAVGGTAGIGKTALTDELARHVQESGGRILRGAAGYPETTSYQCFVEALRSAPALVASDAVAPVWRAALGGLLPELRTPVERPSRLDPGRERQRLFEAIVQVVLALAKDRPLLLVLEDLHWADEATAGALLALARRLPLAPVLVVFTYRDEEISAAHPLRRLRRELQSAGLLDVVSPKALDLAAVRALVEATTALRSDAAHELAASLLERSDGNPLFLTHLVEGFRESGRLHAPQALRMLIAQRLKPLDYTARSVAEIAALAGRSFSAELIEEVTGWDAGRVSRALDTLIERRIVAEKSTPRALEHEFTHQLVRSAIADAVPRARARRRHRRIAVVLQRLHGGREGELAPTLALHYEAAGDAGAAVRQHLEAALNASEIGAQDVAKAHLDRALALTTQRSQRVSVLLAREAVHARSGAREEQRNDLDSLAAIANRCGDPSLRAEVAYRRFCLARTIGARREQAANLAAFERCVRRLPSPDAHRARLYLSQAQYYELLGRLHDAHEATRLALRACGRRSRAQRVDILCTRARIEDKCGDLTASARSLERAGRAADSPAGACRVLEHQTRQALQREDWTTLEQRSAELLSRGRSLGDRATETLALMCLGVSLMGLRRYGDSLAHLELARAHAVETADHPRLAAILANRGLLEMSLGVLDEAQACFERALEIHREQRDVVGTLGCLNNLSAVHVYRRDGARAVACANEALALAREMKARIFETHALENLAEAQAAISDDAAATATMELAVAKRHAIGSQASLTWCLANLAVWYARLGDMTRARRQIARMLGGESLGDGPWPQYAHWAAAQIARRDGDGRSAATHLRQAVQMMEQGSAACPDGRHRQAFHELPWHRDIAAARDGRAWPDPPR